MTPEQQATLKWFKNDKLNHPELVDFEAIQMLDEVREQFGDPLVITDDARASEMPSGASETSWHKKGKAFDLRIRDWSACKLWRFVAAVMNVANWVAARKATMRGVELEIVWSDSDKHAHVAFGTGTANKLLVRAD